MQMCKKSNSIAQTKAGKSEAAYHWQINFPSYLYLQEITYGLSTEIAGWMQGGEMMITKSQCRKFKPQFGNCR